jgi:serine protease
MTLRSRRSLSLIVPAVTTFALAAGAMSAVAQDEPAGGPLNTEEIAEPARGLIVKLADGADSAVSDLVDDVAAELPDDVGVAEAASGPAEMGLLELSEQVDAADLGDAIEQLEANPDVDWVVPNGVRMPSATANDPLYRNMWNLTGAWGVEANKAWDITTGRSSVRVAVVDTGIVANHPDLAGQYVAGRDFVDDEYSCADRSCSRIYYRKSFISANDGNSWDANPADPGDWRDFNGQCDYLDKSNSTWHGTHVAGTIAARRNNGIGVAGIAPGVKVQPVRVLGRCGGTDWDIAMGILWASGANVTRHDGRRHGAIPVNRTPSKVINLSLGGWTANSADVRSLCKFYGQISSIARQRGSTIVAAAGNNGSNHAHNVPSVCPGFIAVAATTQSGLRASFSNFGRGIDVSAPGVGIWSSANAGSKRPGTNTYLAYEGTSMATPAVSAAAALAYSVGITNPDVVERVLKATARRATSCPTTQCGFGVVSAHGVLTARAPTSAPRISGLARPGRTLRATAGSWRNGAAVKLTWYRGSRAVRTGSAYRVTKADIGQRVTVRATATNGSGLIHHQSAVVVKVKPRLSFSIPSKVKKSKKAKVRVRVVAPYVRATGTIRVYDGKRRIAIKKLHAKNKGKVTITLRKLKKGKHRIRVHYSGNSKISSAQRSKVVRSR